MQQTLPDDNPIAICYLRRNQDENNACLLYEKHLTVIRKGKVTTFEVAEIQQLAVDHRKMMLPLIAGGVFSSLSVIAMAQNLFNPWIILTWFMINLLLLYLGWIGHPVLTVQQKAFHTDFPLKNKGKNLKEFINFSNDYLRNLRLNIPKVSPVYHILPRKEWEIVKTTQTYEPLSLKKEGYIHFSTKEQIPQVRERYFQNQKDLVILQIDPLKLKAELKYELVYEQENLYPHLYGPLNLEAIVDVQLLIS